MNPQIPEVLKYQSIQQSVLVGDLQAYDVGVLKYTDSDCFFSSVVSGSATPKLQSLDANVLGDVNRNKVINQTLSINSLLDISNISQFTGILSGQGNTVAYNGADLDGTRHFFVFWDCYSNINIQSSCTNCACASSLAACRNNYGKLETIAYNKAIANCPDTLYLGNLSPLIATTLVPNSVPLSGTSYAPYPCSECVGCYGSAVDSI